MNETFIVPKGNLFFVSNFVCESRAKRAAGG